MFDYSVSTPWHPITTNELPSRKRLQQQQQQTRIRKYPLFMECNHVNLSEHKNGDNTLETNLKR